MSTVHEVFHGTEGDNVLSILGQGLMRPDEDHEIYFSQRFEDALKHGADEKRRAAFAFKARVTIPDGASVRRAQKPGNPLTVIVTTVLPISVAIEELYVRIPIDEGFEFKVVKGEQSIRAFLLR